ncbi:MAG: alpha/beta hydrolase [Halieaceae bacterium]
MQSQPRHYEVPLQDITLSVHEWAGPGDPILLLHATGFHSRCWDQIVQRLPDRHVYAVDLRFHGASTGKGDVDWVLMAHDIEQLIDHLDLHNIVGVGHSLGGHLVARVAAERIERFKSLVLIDPVILPRDRYETAPELAEMTPDMHPVSRRKNQWIDSDEMFERFRQKPPFNGWQEDVLRDYCRYALVEVPGESYLQLACDPLHEAAVYLNKACNNKIYKLLPNLELPVTLMRAPPVERAAINLSGSPTFPGLIDLLPQGKEIYLPHLSHFIPMEDPDLVAKTILEAAAAQNEPS